MPMRLQTDGMVIAIPLERGKLTNPIDHARAHGGPRRFFVIADFGNVLTMAMTDAVFRQNIVATGVGSLAAPCGVARIPIEHEGG